MLADELRGIYPAAGVLPITRTDERRQELAHLEMQVRPIKTSGVTDRRDLFAAPHILVWLDQHRLDVRVIRLHVFPPAILFVSVQNDDDVAPAWPAYPRQQDPAIGHGVDRVAQVAVFTADAIQVVAQMAVLGERLRVIGEGAVLGPDRKIKAAGGRQCGEFRRTRELESG